MPKNRPDEAELGQLAGSLIMSSPQGQALATAMANTVVQGGAAAVVAGGAAVATTASIVLAALPLVALGAIGYGIIKSVK